MAPPRHMKITGKRAGCAVQPPLLVLALLACVFLHSVVGDVWAKAKNKAKSQTNSAVVAPPASPQELLTQARAAEAAQQYAQATSLYRTYLATRPEDDEVRGLLARVLSWQRQYDEAVALYQDILSRHPVDFDTRTALARVKSWQQQYAEARRLYEQVLAEQSGNVEARRGLADVLFWTGESAAALPHYEAVLAATADAEVARRIQAIKAELAPATTPPATRPAARTPQKTSSYEAPQTPRAPTGQGETELSLPYRNYLKVGYGRFAYTKGIVDEQVRVVEGAKSFGPRTLVGRIEVLSRFGLDDTALSGEFYSPLWGHAWGYLGASVGIEPDFVAQWSLGGEVTQNLGFLHPVLAALEPSLGYRYTTFRDTRVHLLTPGLTVYLPYNLWLTEKVSYTPDTGAATLTSQLTWRPTNRVQVFVSGAFGTFGERLATRQDFRRISTRILQVGVTFPLTSWLSAEVSGYDEDRKTLNRIRGGSGHLIVHW